MFRHPNYYKNLRKLARNSELHVRPQGSEASDTDQAISPTRATAPSRRATGPGLKQQASSTKQQASSKPEPVQVQTASSAKRQASPIRVASIKHQATSSKLRDS